jgi:hypothetical protein
MFTYHLAIFFKESVITYGTLHTDISTERCRVANTPVLYSGGSGFKSRPGYSD